MKVGVLPLMVLSLLITACERERRGFKDEGPAPEAEAQILMSTLSAGPEQPTAQGASTAGRYEDNAYHVNEGKTLFSAFNCKGCHANGGGDSGPPLMDDKWIYGGSIENIARTIVEGRPNGMPSFRNRITNEQLWQIAAYVRSMGRNVRKDVAPGRSDAIHNPPAESRRPPQEPQPGGPVPPSAEGRQ
jgi:cytochrome c oxidase cbb3-type subunit 3